MDKIDLVFLILIIIWLAFSLYLDCSLLYYKDEVKWIERKMRSLDALINDYDQLVKKGDEVKSRARYFWDLGDLSGIHLQLSEPGNEWVKSTKEVVREAKDFVDSYERQNLGLLRGSTTTILRTIPIIDVLRQINSVRSKMTDHIKENDEKAKNIYMEMEKSRSQNRSLLDQYTIEKEDKSVAEEADKSVAAQNPKKKKKKKPSPSLDELMKKSKDLLSSMEERWSIYLLLPLHAFVKDLSQFQLETETEKLWKTEAEELIAHAEDCISYYSWWLSVLWIRKKNNPIVMQEFGGDMKNIVTDFDDLLTRKEKYNFAFIDRAPEKSSFLCIPVDQEITSLIDSIHRKLNNLDKSLQQVAEMDSWHLALKEMHEQLQIAEDTAGGNACLEQLKSIAQEVDNFLERHMNGPELKRLEIKNAINLLRKIIRICRIERQKSTKIVGLKNEIQDLVSKLTTSSDNPSTLSIVGMSGVGKTTLAKAVYYDKGVVEHFPIRVWVVTEGAAHKFLLIKRDGTKYQTLDVTQVCHYLKENLCLVVLDNVSKTEYFDNLSRTLSRSGWSNGSRIVLTTRFKDVALHADSSTPYQIRLLTKEESWKLFQKETNMESAQLQLKLEKLAKKVVGKCGGLPLAILSLGWVMSAKGGETETQDILRWVLKQINQVHHKAYWLQAWEKNEKELGDTVSNCLYYFTHFPEDFEIPARRLVNLWVAEGLVQQNNRQTAEDTAERYLEELRDRNLIQVVALKSNAKIKTCRLPSMLRKDILQNSDRTRRSQYLGTHLEQRFAYHFDDRGLDANSAAVLSKEKIPRTVFFFDKREGRKPGEHVGKILSTGIASEQFLEIRVLDLERMFRPQLPKSLSKLNHIKYLSLRWTYLEEFPLCICKLMELETLDLKHTCIRVIPSSIWKLKKLKNLYLNHKYRSKLEGKPSGDFHENLHTLWGGFLYGSYPLLHYLHKLKNLQKLKLAFQLTDLESDTVAEKIEHLKQLHSLRLRSINEDGGPEKLILNDMSNLEKLSSLHLFGILKHNPRMSHLPKNLTDLTLSASNLSDDPMPELQNLPKLKSLCFYADSYTESRMTCARGSFQQLQVLRFWNLRHLQEWDVVEGAMPSLMEFEARSCRNLKCPTGLKHLRTLRMIKLQEMSEQFMRDISNLKKTDLDDVELDDDWWTPTTDPSP